MKHINENYNIGLLMLVHLFLVVVLELVIFYFVLKPAIEKHMKKLADDLPKLDEETLKNYGIYHSPIYATIIKNVFKNNESLTKLLEMVNDENEGSIPDEIKAYFNKKEIKDKIREQKSSTNIKLKLWYIMISVLMTIIVWYVIHMNHKHIKTDIPELILGNLIPLTMIFIFELYFIQNIAVKYKVMGEHGFLYTVLNRLYPSLK